MRRDAALGAVIARHGPCGLADGQRDHGLQAMIESIVWQQLSGKAAATIYARFLALFLPSHLYRHSNANLHIFPPLKIRLF